MQRPKLRDGNASKRYELYPLGQIPEEMINEIGRRIIYTLAMGKRDISGEDWGDIFANAITGTHLNKPIGLADVTVDNMAWSVKSVKHETPHNCKKVRVISGRCSPDYSYGINDPYVDVEQTGRAVLGIWNERVNIAKDAFEPLRSSLLIRNPDSLDFALMEYELTRFNTHEYTWRVNPRGNFEGRRKDDDRHQFTWQPHGAQFTILHTVSSALKRFTLRRPNILNFEETMTQIGFDESWVTILPA